MSDRELRALGFDGSTGTERVGGPTAILAGMRIALLGLGLIGGSVARALRDPTRGGGSSEWAGRRVDPERPRARPGAGGQRHRPGRAVAGGRHRRRGSRPACRARAGLLSQLDELAERGTGRSCPTPSSPTSQAPGSHRPASDGPRIAICWWPPDGRARNERVRGVERRSVRRSAWVVVPTTDTAAVERVEHLALRGRRAPRPARCRRPRPGGRGHQPPAVGGRLGAGRGRRRERRCGTVRGLADRSEPGCERLG